MNYLLSVFPGLARVAAEELREKCGQKAGRPLRMRNAELVPVQAGVGGLLLELRTVEDVFVELGRHKLSGQLADVKALPQAPVWGKPLREALAVWSRVTGRPLVKRQQFRVVVQADDVQWRQYRRQELMLAAERAMLAAGASWRLNRDETPLEVWLQQVGRELVVSVRLSDNTRRQRGGRAVEREAALRPTVAAALVWLTRLRDADVFLDPMCGSGTILLERAVAGRYQQLVGGDSDPAAVAAALANFGPRHQPRRIERWDARALPLADDSVTAIACNLPWGRQVGEKAAMPALYAAVLPEWARVLASGGRMVLLTSEWDVLKTELRARPELELEQTVANVEILGRRADIFVLTKH
jgi:tRNA (guanine6-N2)-methyltransferase